MTDVRDRILEITDLLMGAAYADGRLEGDEEDAVRELLGELLDDFDLPLEVEKRINGFDHAKLDLAATAKAFAGDPGPSKKKLLELVSRVHEADQELDLAEDEYLKKLAAALGVPAADYAGLALDIQIEELREDLATLRKPPPPPKA